MDVLFVGGGPAGLAGAIELARLAREDDELKELEIGVLEKSAGLGEHCLSGAVIDPRPFRELFHGISDEEFPFRMRVPRDRVYLLTSKGKIRLPTPPTMHNKNNWVGSLCEVVRWMGEKAEAAGVNIFTGFPADALLVGGDRVLGVRTTPAGLDKAGNPGNPGNPGSGYAEPTDVSARVTVLCEGTRGSLTQAYLARIRAYDQAGPGINSMIWVNANAIAEAEALDQERADAGPRGPLHGIPIILKDNFDTYDMPTSAGTLALAGNIPPNDAFPVAKLRDAGVIIIGKSNMHEMAGGITTIGSLGGQTLNPYDLRRNPGGSSGGTGAAIAASFAAVGWGSDTCGSLLIPAAHNNLVGLRPTKGLSSIDGIIPGSHTEDTDGPLARTVRDLAVALDATVGRDRADPPATAILEGRELPRFVDELDAGAGRSPDRHPRSFLRRRARGRRDV